jgi:hypothetical protein
MLIAFSPSKGQWLRAQMIAVRSRSLAIKEAGGMSETKQRYRAEIETAIKVARRSGLRSDVDAKDGAQIYAYPLTEGRIAWGVNAADTGWNTLRAVRETNGADTGLSDALASNLDLEKRYVRKLQGLSDAALEREAADKCWQSGYAASREDHDSHWQWLACEGECTRRGKLAIAERAWSAATGPTARRAPPLMIREARTGAHLPVQVLKGAAGYYLGTLGSDGFPYSRESVEYWKKPLDATVALELGQWSARRHANPPPPEFGRDQDAVIPQSRGRGR